MRLLACDFDGTVFCEHSISERDLLAIARWRAEGNLFGIVTGRGAGTLLADLSRFPLEYDFLLCNNGALLLDSRANPVAERPLGIEMSRYLLDHEIREHCSSCALFAGAAMYVLEETGPWLNPVYTPSTLPVQKARDIDFLQISFGFRERTRSMAWGERLQADVAGKAQVQCSLSVADVTARGVGKATGIAWALDALCLSPGNILTVGDDGNDREMLAAYDGYAMEGADRDVLAAAGKSTASIADLVEQCL